MSNKFIFLDSRETKYTFYQVCGKFYGSLNIKFSYFYLSKGILHNMLATPQFIRMWLDFYIYSEINFGVARFLPLKSNRYLLFVLRIERVKEISPFLSNSAFETEKMLFHCCRSCENL